MDFKIRNDLTDGQVDDLVRLYQSEWWTRGRQKSEVCRMLAHCDVIVAITDAASGRLVGFARVLTDFVYKALIFDVIVDTAHRSHGLGGTLMDAVVHHPALQAVKHMELYCLPEMVPFYQRRGFTSGPPELRVMRLARS